jgi:hypothetical protein
MPAAPSAKGGGGAPAGRACATSRKACTFAMSQSKITMGSSYASSIITYHDIRGSSRRGACIGVVLQQVQYLSALHRRQGPVCTQTFHARGDRRLHVSKDKRERAHRAVRRRRCVAPERARASLAIGARVRLTVVPAFSRSPWSCTRSWPWCARPRLGHFRLRSASKTPLTACSSSCFLEAFVTISETWRNVPCGLRDGAHSWRRHEKMN